MAPGPRSTMQDGAATRIHHPTFAILVARVGTSDICRMPQTPGPIDDESPLAGAIIGLLTLVAVGGVTDLVLDDPASWWSAHVLLEVVMVVASMTMATLLWLRWRGVTTELRATQATLASRQVELESWRASSEEALRSFGQAVAAQMTRWELTPSEREVALLLLQGLGHKQIAGQTGRSERTVRQHAVSVYNKSGQHGRAELAAFFLTGLTLPEVEPPTE